MACSDQKSQPPAPDPQKIAALDDALKNGLLTQKEYDAKLKALNASGSSTVRPAASTPGKVKISTRMRTVEVQDPVFGIIAFRMQIPEDWKFEGAMLRNPACGMAAGVVYRASSPDGLVGVQIVPTFIWFWSNNPIYLSTYRQAQCRTMPPMSAADFLPVVASYIRPNVTAR